MSLLSPTKAQHKQSENKKKEAEVKLANLYLKKRVKISTPYRTYSAIVFHNKQAQRKKMIIKKKHFQNNDLHII